MLVQTQTSGHSWQVVTGATPASGCSSSTQTFNPYNINTGEWVGG